MNAGVKKFLVSGLGMGFLRPAPGTWGSAGACAVLLAVGAMSGWNWLAFQATAIAIVVLASVACVALGRFAEQAFGRKDPSQVTSDEWAGQAATFLLVPMGSTWQSWLVVGALGFVMFRVFDIVKPPPARQLEHLPFGWGVLLDDLMAGVYANIATRLAIAFVLPKILPQIGVL